MLIHLHFRLNGYHHRLLSNPRDRDVQVVDICHERFERFRQFPRRVSHLSLNRQLTLALNLRRLRVRQPNRLTHRLTIVNRRLRPHRKSNVRVRLVHLRGILPRHPNLVR